MISHCTKCNAIIDLENVEISKKFVRCKNCNSWNEVTQAMRGIHNKCPTCNYSNELDALYCTSCGMQLKPITARTILRCEICGTEYDGNNRFCKHDGGKLSSVESTNEGHQSTNRNNSGSPVTRRSGDHGPNMLSKLSNGDYGLFNTYWIFGLVVGAIFQIILRIPNTNAFISISIIYILYEMVVLVGIWNASKRYSGSALWASLAKAVVVIGWITLSFYCYIVIKMVI